VYPAVNASALPTANLDFIGLSFGAIFETKPAPTLAVGKEQIEKQYLLWNREQRPTSFTTDLLSELVDPINLIPTARAGAGLVSKIAPKLSPIKSRFRLFYFYGTHGLSFSTFLSTFILPSSFFPPLYLTTAFAPSMPPADIPPIICG
jgi:hypothetical protein